MSLSIRQRCQKVAECIHLKGLQGLEAIANASGLTISSVYRHQKAIASLVVRSIPSRCGGKLQWVVNG